MHYKDPLDPLRTPAPRHEYYSDDDEDDVAEHRPPQPSPTSADLSIHWDSPPASASASSSLPIHLLIFIGALTRPLQHGLLPQRSSRKGKMVMSRSNVETEVLDVEEVDGKEERLMVASTVGHLSADWLYPIAIKLLETCRSPSQTLEITILDSYIPQTFIHTITTSYIPNPPVRFLRSGHAQPFSPTTEFQRYPSPNYVTGLGAALINASSHTSSTSSSPIPTTLLLLPTPLHPSQIISALSPFPHVSTALQGIWNPIGKKVWDDEELGMDESGGRVDHHAVAKKGGKVDLAEIGEGGMYI